jgi:hypothetical protein
MGVMDRVAALGDMLSGVAGVVAPAAAASRAGTPAATALMEGLLGGSPTQQAASDTMRAVGRDVVERLNQPGQMPTTYANPIPGLRLYHGSPHDFDRFSMSKIGTGEGAQAYGHGLYFAENEGIARSYRDNLLDARIPQVNEQLKELSREMGKISSGYRQWKPGFADEGKALAEEYDSLLDERSRMKGRMYEVNVNANPEDFLDWDKPFASADDLERFAARFDAVDPALRKRIEDFGYVRQQMGQPMPDGNDIIREVMGGIGSKDAARASETMREAGIPGIRYLDAGSRSFTPTTIKDTPRGSELYWGNDPNPVDVFPTRQAAEEAAKQFDTRSRNYVVFDENLINIVRKYGIAGAAAALGVSQADVAQAMGLQQQQQPQGLLSGAQ